MEQLLEMLDKTIRKLVTHHKQQTWVGLCDSDRQQCIWEPLAGTRVVTVTPPQLPVSSVFWTSGSCGPFTVPLPCSAPASSRPTVKYLKFYYKYERCDFLNKITGVPFPIQVTESGKAARNMTSEHLYFLWACWLTCGLRNIQTYHQKTWHQRLLSQRDGQQPQISQHPGEIWGLQGHRSHRSPLVLQHLHHLLTRGC